MAETWTLVKEKRVTFLSIFEAIDVTDEDERYDVALALVNRLEADGLFDAEKSRPTSAPRGRSGGRGSGGQSSSRGRDQARGGGMRDPDGPPSDKQVKFLLQLTDDYTEDEVYDMTKKEVSDLIEDLKRGT